MIEITVEGKPEECRHTVCQLRLMSSLSISAIYEQNRPSEESVSYYIRLEEDGDPRWSLESLPDPESFFDAVRRFTWGDWE